MRVENFLLVNEIQMCDGFERTINGLHTLERYDIFITGSNAFLLSSDLSMLFAGRTFKPKLPRSRSQSSVSTTRG